MAKSITQALPELIREQVISEETAEKIRQYYEQKEPPSQNRLFIVFGVLGALLVGLGIILIIGHNWDDFSRSTKTVLSFLPLVIGQLLCGYTLFKKSNDTGWRESTATFLFLAVGASIALIGQVYHIPGNLESYLFTWALLGIPLVYVMRASVVSLLYIAGITWYACEGNYWVYGRPTNYHYWWMLLLVLPYVYLLWKKKPNSNFMIFHHWFLSISLIITLGTLGNHTEELLFIAYFSLFGLYYLFGKSQHFNRQKARNNSWFLLGSAGTLALLFSVSFEWFWKVLERKPIPFSNLWQAQEFYAALLLTLAASILLFRRKREVAPTYIDLIPFTFLLFFILFFIGSTNTILPIVVVNSWILAMGIFTIRQGAKRNLLGMLNYGLAMIAVLVICRFFDVQFSFVIRGVLFLLVGTGFFLLNYQLLKKRKSNQTES